MSDKPKNPQAFPTKNMLFNTRTNNVEVVEHGGMTLSDYFAGQVITGYLANPNFDSKAVSEEPEVFIKGIYEIAKSMLKERYKRT